MISNCDLTDPFIFNFKHAGLLGMAGGGGIMPPSVISVWMVQLT